MSKLAIIIPYYKKVYFDQLMRSLCCQSNKNFNLYIFDDNSPENPEHIISMYDKCLNIKYVKFFDNLGGVDLASHWNRCLSLIGDEDWVWILPDDDLPSNNIVEEFHKILPIEKQYNIKVFRIPINFIDSKGNIIREIPVDKYAIEDNISFYKKILRGETSSTLGDNIYNKRTLDQIGGFVSFPRGWGSDHATLLKVSKGGKIGFIPNTTFSFRMSEYNISSQVDDGVIKLRARVKFAKWLRKNYDIFPEELDNEFWKYFYWKGEYYFLNIFTLNIDSIIELMNLQKVSFGTIKFLLVIKIIIKKLFKK